MAKPPTTPAQRLLALSLTSLKTFHDQGRRVIQSSEMPRNQRECLLKNGFLQPIVSGWYMSTHPADRSGDSTPWVASMLEFVQSYSNARFANDWCLSPDLSIKIHTESTITPRQVIVHATKAGNSVLGLPFGNSLLDYRAQLPSANYVQVARGLRVMSLPYALTRIPESFYQSSKDDALIALRMLQDTSELNRILLEDDKSVVAGRLAGALRAVGRSDFADDVSQFMLNAGYRLAETDPFSQTIGPLARSSASVNPVVERINLMWQNMRPVVQDSFANREAAVPPRTEDEIAAFMQAIEDVYVTDAYHSLSIEGYRVTAELIERVANGNWNPDDHVGDQNSRDALAAHGYWLSHNAVKDSIKKALNGKANAGAIARTDHRLWYRELFSPSVQARILNASDLAGYRTHPVYIRNARHAPLRAESVREAMPALFDLMENENDPTARAVLGHFVFVYIHPYMDGNGRIGRFLMNASLTSAGYPWVVIPLERRDQYMAALDAASSNGDIKPFADFVAGCLLATEGQNSADTERKRSDFPVG